jgi:hypothetical protein
LNKTAQNDIAPLPLSLPLPACLLAHVRLNFGLLPAMLRSARSTSQTRARV